MSTTYSIGCRQCRKHLWIAQASGKERSLYTGQPETMEELKTFLFEHVDHPLVFGENCEGEIGEWEEIETSTATQPDRFEKSLQLAGELIAMIRVNALRGTFATATSEEVEEHLKPWTARLLEIHTQEPNHAKSKRRHPSGDQRGSA